jgi:alkanesulfonate monooxygenase SsuD/methylene tetrahydromethanopterin reductase-like flavin-dependent oxidoreductase (luciferase family)
VSGPRLGLAVTGADAAEIARLAPLAEANNLDAMLVGAIRGGAPNSDDTYVVTAAAAAATRTRYLRIAVALDLRGSASPLRIAEDLGVLDVMSNGRLELVLRPGPEPEWSRDLEAILGAWRAWPLEDPDADPGPGPGGPSGASMPVTPSPVQPEIPTWLMDTCEPPAARPLSRGSSLVFLDWPQPSVAPDAAAIPDAAALREIRRMRDDAGAATVVVDIAGMPPERRAEVIQVLGTVVAPCLRCPDDEVGILALDARDWLVHRTELHRPPLDDPALEEPSDIR